MPPVLIRGSEGSGQAEGGAAGSVGGGQVNAEGSAGQPGASQVFDVEVEGHSQERRTQGHGRQETSAHHLVEAAPVAHEQWSADPPCGPPPATAVPA